MRNLCRLLESEGYEVTWLGVDQTANSISIACVLLCVLTRRSSRSCWRTTKPECCFLSKRSDASCVKTPTLFFTWTACRQWARFRSTCQTSICSHCRAISCTRRKVSARSTFAKESSLSPLIIGGAQEQGRRAGTSAVPNIVGLGAACRLALEDDDHARIERLRNRLEDEILRTIPNARLNGVADRSKRLPNTSNISFEYVDGQNILMHLDQAGICVSTGSACHSTTHESSPTLRAMNVPYTAAQGSIRFSLGRYNTESEIETTLSVLPEIIAKLAAMSPYDKELAALK